MNFDYRAIDLLILLGSLFLGWLWWGLKKEFVDKKQCSNCKQDIEKDITGLGARVSRNEELLKGLPSTEDVQELALGLERLFGSIGRLEERINGANKSLEKLERTVDRQEDYMKRRG